MKAKPFNIFLVIYVVILTCLAITGYMISDYTIKARQHEAQLNHYFATDLTLYDLPRMNINVATGDKNSSNRVRIDVSLEVTKQDMQRVSSFEPRIMDRIVTFMRKQDVEEIRPPMAMTWLHRTLLEEVNEASKPVPVRDVVFRQFVVL